MSQFNILGLTLSTPGLVVSWDHLHCKKHLCWKISYYWCKYSICTIHLMKIRRGSESVLKVFGPPCKPSISIHFSTDEMQTCSSTRKLRVKPSQFLSRVFWPRRRWQPIRGQYSGHVICIDQSEASIQVTWSALTNQRPRQRWQLLRRPESRIYLLLLFLRIC